jgi:tetratricopeptide (TPR) repeat protein
MGFVRQRAIITLAISSLLLPAFGETPKNLDRLETAKQYLDAHPDNADALLRYAAVARTSREWTESKEAYEKFLQLYPNHVQAKLAEAAIKQIRSDIELMPDAWTDKLSPSDYYLVDTVRNGVRHWKPTDMPLKVYIEPGPENAIRIAKKGIDEWAAASQGAIQFTIVPDKASSNIEFNWTTDRMQPDVADRQGTTMSKRRNGKEHSVIIVLLTSHYNQKPLDDASLAHTIVHEFGHALGLRHSGSTGDVMYAGGKYNVVSQGDATMLRMLYKTPPEQLMAKAIEIVQKSGVPPDTALAHLIEMQGRTHELKKDFAGAATWYGLAYDAYAKSKDDKETDDTAGDTFTPSPRISANMVRDMTSLGRVYYTLKQYDAAAKWYGKVCDALRAQQKDQLLVPNLLIFAGAAAGAGQNAEATEAINQAKLLMEKVETAKEDKAFALYRMAVAYRVLKNFQPAIDCYAEACSLYDTLKIQNPESAMCHSGQASLRKYIRTMDTWANNLKDPESYEKYADQLISVYGTSDSAQVKKIIQTRIEAK